MGDRAVHFAQGMAGTYVDGPIVFACHIHRGRFHRQGLEWGHIRFYLDIHGLVPPDDEPHFAIVI
jgi:hypothetical protein